MLTDSPAFASFAAPDLAAVHRFYTETLGLRADLDQPMEGLLTLHPGGGREVLVYRKPDHVPAGFTVLNFPVPDIGEVVDELTARGVEFVRYDGFEQDEKGIARAPEGPAIAWFRDPAGNGMAVLEE